jgi:hypothetical protein
MILLKTIPNLLCGWQRNPLMDSSVALFYYLPSSSLILIFLFPQKEPGTGSSLIQKDFKNKNQWLLRK